MTFSVTIETDYGRCGHEENGCSGWERTTITAIHPTRGRFEVSKSSCFGIDMGELVTDLLNKVSGAQDKEGG